MASKEINFGLLQSARKPKTLDGTPLSPRDTKRQSITRKAATEVPPVITVGQPTEASPHVAPEPTPKFSKERLSLKLPLTPAQPWRDQPSSTRKMMKDKIAHEVRKTLEEPGTNPHAEFVKYATPKYGIY